jgi:MinD-like ATPase involved in chromosome partitioning or flagellar assembly
VELPTYTNIWKIEKRLYKLYDFRLPMPLPVGQVTAFLAIAIPYMLILTMAGMPFSHTWVWLYVLPPGVLAWLVTRPVLEGKRLPELVLSQLRYLAEPRTWCRMTPLAEKDQMFITARVWRQTASGKRSVACGEEDTRAADTALGFADGESTHAEGADRVEAMGRPEMAAAPEPAARPVWPNEPALGSIGAVAAPDQVRAPSTAAAGPEQIRPPSTSPRPTAADPPRGATRPAVTVRATGAREVPVVERALRTGPGERANGWRERVVVVPGGHRPGKPDQLQRDQARARLALPGPARVVVLGCTAGAGQTTVTLLTGQLLATLRGEAVAVLDIGSGPGSLTERACLIPRLLPGHRDRAATVSGSAGERGLQVVTADAPADQFADAGRLIDAVVDRYHITIADPAAAHVPRAVQAADQLVLVTPANGDAAGALAMTLEWLEAHGNADLGRSAVTVLNGVSAATAEHVDRAAAVATGRCRAIVRVPWDDRLTVGRAVGIATVQAFTALAGVLVAGLAKRAPAGAPTGAGRP